MFCGIFFLCTFGALVYMFFQFTGCATNNAFISLTLILCILLPIAQLTGGEGNLLSVACISVWATFLCYTAIIKNPEATCNPLIGESSPISITYGLLLTLISLSWAGWSYTAEDKLTDAKYSSNTNEVVIDSHDKESDILEKQERVNRGKRDVAGVVVIQSETDATADDNYIPVDEKQTSNEEVTETSESSKTSNAWRLNVALAVVSCWCAMTLTEWGVVQANDGTIANRNVGHVSMWVIIGSQWFVMSLYLWTLIAPRLFPNRDFN
jgi:serine incorporator 1/3